MKNKRKNCGKLLLSLLVFLMLGMCYTNIVDAKSTKPVTTKKITVSIGKTGKIKSGKYKASRLRFKSNNKKIATVSNKGNVKGKKKGITHVNVYIRSGKRIARIRVCVLSKVKTIRFKYKEKVCGEYTQFNLQPIIKPQNANDKRLKWKSSNHSVATVSRKGVVKTKKKGWTNITAYTIDGTKKKASYRVTVKRMIKGVVLEKHANHINMQRNSVRKIRWEVVPSNADNKKIKWKSSDISIATVTSDGMVKSHNKGQAIITLTTLDGSGVEKSIAVNVVSLTSRDTHFVAHKGLSSQAPENTLAAFQLACEKGFWGVECDIYRTKDNQFVISHDSTLSRMCNVDEKISDLTLEEIQSYKLKTGANVFKYPDLVMPSLQQYLELLSEYNDMHAIIEIKEESLTQEDAILINSLIEQYDMQEKTIMIDVSQENLLKVQEQDGEHKMTFQLITNRLTLDDVQWCKLNGMGISCYYGKLAAVLEMGMLPSELGTWTVDDVCKAYEIIQTGKCDYITTNEMLFDEY